MGCLGLLQTYLSIAVAVDDGHKETLEKEKECEHADSSWGSQYQSVLCQNVEIEKLGIFLWFPQKII